MNRSRIEWCDHTWNPITGCRHGCKYCYARRHVARFAGDVRLNKMAKDDYVLVPAADGGDPVYVLDAPMQNTTGSPLVYPFGFEPTFHRYRMDVPQRLKMGNNIFVGAMSDIFGAWVRDEWINEVLGVCMENPIHNYLFLTKNPGRYPVLPIPTGHDNLWFGTTVTREAEMDRLLSLPLGCKPFVSFEPLLEDIHVELHRLSISLLEWVIIGAETGRKKGKATPKREWIQSIVGICNEEGIPVFMKDSLIPIVGEEGMCREFPERLRHPKVSPKVEKKLYGECGACKEVQRKNEMVALLARYERGKRPKQFGYMCRKCFEKFCGENGWDIPEPAGGSKADQGDGEDG